LLLGVMGTTVQDNRKQLFWIYQPKQLVVIGIMCNEGNSNDSAIKQTKL